MGLFDFFKKKKNEEENISEVPEKRDYEEELLKLIKSDEPPERLREDLSDYHENDIASILPELSQEERAKLYRLLGTEKMSEIFPYLDDVEEYIEELIGVLNCVVNKKSHCSLGLFLEITFFCIICFSIYFLQMLFIGTFL